MNGSLRKILKSTVLQRLLNAIIYKLERILERKVLLNKSNAEGHVVLYVRIEKLTCLFTVAGSTRWTSRTMPEAMINYKEGNAKFPRHTGRTQVGNIK